MKKKEIIELIKSIPFLDSNDLVSLTVIMGAALVLNNIRQDTEDIDLSVTQKLFDKLKKQGLSIKETASKYEKAQWQNISFYKNWPSFDRSLIDGIFVASLESIFFDKIQLGRPKDFRDLMLISNQQKANTDKLKYFEVFSFPNQLRGFLHLGWKNIPIVIVHGYFSSNRIGPHRLYYQIAERLNEMGFTVLRIDLSAMGESDGKLEEICFNRHVIDLQICIDRLLSVVDSSKVHLLGHCAGCFNILANLILLENVDSATLISPIYAQEESFNLLLGEMNYKQLLKEDFIYRKGLFCHKSFIDAAFYLQDDKYLDKLKKIKSCIFLPECDEFSNSKEIVELAKKNQIKYCIINSADHNFLTQASRFSLMNSLVEWYSCLGE